jgi:hypothetical protein
MVMRRFQNILLLGFCLACLCSIYLLITVPKKNELHHLVGRFHSLIEPNAQHVEMCGGPLANEGATYRLELWIVMIPYRKGKCEVPPLSGYVTSLHRFLEEVQGSIDCSALHAPPFFLSDDQEVGLNSGFVFKLKKFNEHFHLKYTLDSGATYSQEFDLPEGEIFVTTLAEHPMSTIMEKQILPSFLSRFQPYSPCQMQHLLLIRYHEVESADNSRPLGPGVNRAMTPQLRQLRD